jgi:hypothetical protein
MNEGNGLLRPRNSQAEAPALAIATGEDRPVGDEVEEQAIGKSDNKIREIGIRQLHFGYIVTVGCHNFAIESSDKIIDVLGQYLKNPNETEQKWFKGELLK